ncbi:MAG: transporter substrate-binding domain-containing protein [Alphaproteobacteria bacterium]
MTEKPERDRDGVNRRDMLTLSSLGVAGAAAIAGAAGLGVSARKAAAQTAGGRLQAVLERGHVIVGTGSTNPPWHFEDAAGGLQGMDIDMARLLAKGLFDDDQKVEFVIGASDARIPNLATDKVDVIFQFMTVTAGRAQQVEFTIPYYREGVGLMLMKGEDIQTYDQLKAGGADITVSALQNVFIEDWIRLALPDAKVDQYESVDAEIQALNSGRAHAAALDQSTIGWLLAQFPDRYVDSGYGWMPNSYAAAVKPGDQVWLNFVNSVLHEAMTGVDFLSYQASFKKWFGADVPPPRTGFPVEYA